MWSNFFLIATLALVCAAQLQGDCNTVSFQLLTNNVNYAFETNTQWFLDGPLSFDFPIENERNEFFNPIVNGVVINPDTTALAPQIALIPGTYTLTVIDNDSESQGLATPISQMGISVGGVYVDFSVAETVTFTCTAENPAPCDTVFFTIIVDNYPYDLDYSIFLLADSSADPEELIFTRSLDEVNAGATTDEIVAGVLHDGTSLEGGNYRLVVTDSFGDGILSEASDIRLEVGGVPDLRLREDIRDFDGLRTSFTCFVPPPIVFDCGVCDARDHVGQCHEDKYVRNYLLAARDMEDLTSEELATLDIFMNQSISAELTESRRSENGYENGYRNGESGYNNYEGGEYGYHNVVQQGFGHEESGPHIPCQLARAQLECCIHCTIFQQTADPYQYVLANNLYTKFTQSCQGSTTTATPTAVFTPVITNPVTVIPDGDRETNDDSVLSDDESSSLKDFLFSR